MSTLSICIPSRNEIFLKRTIEDVLEKATGDIEIFPILDGYDIPEEEVVHDKRVHYIHFKTGLGKRQGINAMVAVCKGEYVMSLDAHCMMSKGFDEQLIKDHQPNWVQVPRRNRLDAENWCLQEQSDDRPPIDYEYIMFPGKFTPRSLHGFKWDAKSRERADVMLDETMGMQASCWFMSKKWFKERGFMDYKYQNWGQENEEIVMETYKNGGKLITNKNCCYSHLHKGRKYGRMYFLSQDMTRKSYAYAYQKWVIEEKEFFIKFINKFMPIPGWPDNWKEILYDKEK